MAKLEKKVILEVAGKQYDMDAVASQALEDCKKKAEMPIKEFQVYVKPEDGKAYYTANADHVNGNIDL